MKPVTPFANFEALDIRVGRIMNVEDAATEKPTYRITVDLGPEVGIKKSCAAFRNYNKEELMGRLIVAVVNFLPKRMGPEMSEVLILGVPDARGETIYLTPASEVPLGGSIF
jgi:tRNA-binding protein